MSSSGFRARSSLVAFPTSSLIFVSRAKASTESTDVTERLIPELTLYGLTYVGCVEVDSYIEGVVFRDLEYLVTRRCGCCMVQGPSVVVSCVRVPRGMVRDQI